MAAEINELIGLHKEITALENEERKSQVKAVEELDKVRGFAAQIKIKNKAVTALKKKWTDYKEVSADSPAGLEFLVTLVTTYKVKFRVHFRGSLAQNPVHRQSARDKLIDLGIPFVLPPAPAPPSAGEE